MRGLAAVLLALTLAACGRPLTESETRFARAVFGNEIDVKRVRVAQDLGLLPPFPTVPVAAKALRGTSAACVRTPQPAGERPPPEAFALYNTMFFRSGLYSGDMALTWPRGLRFPQALVLAHELTHVWQWQNRARTGYTPIRAVAESVRQDDPYFSAGDEAPSFHAFGFEQQAAMVEDFVCFTIANPAHPRRAELRALLAPVLPVADFEAAVER